MSMLERLRPDEETPLGGTGPDRGVPPPQAGDSWKFEKILGRMSLLGNGSR
jgi:hypothetical protein